MIDWNSKEKSSPDEGSHCQTAFRRGTCFTSGPGLLGIPAKLNQMHPVCLLHYSGFDPCG